MLLLACYALEYVLRSPARVPEAVRCILIGVVHVLLLRSYV